MDYYSFFDATVQSEFLFECVDFTLNKIFPQEVDYLQKYDLMKAWLDDKFEMPDKLVALLVRFDYYSHNLNTWQMIIPQTQQTIVKIINSFIS